MRAVISTPTAVTRVELRDDLPEPAPAPHEALIAVESFSLNRGELALLGARGPGWRPGQDIAGSVVTAARDGSGPPQGARVCALAEQGGWAERIAVPTDRLAVIPSGVDTAKAAALPMAGRTALRTLALGGAVLGRRVLITGAAGGVGHLQTQLAAAAGADVVAVTRRGSMRPSLLAAGAGVIDRVQSAEGLFDLVLEGVGGTHLRESVGRVAAGGLIVLYGASEPEPAQLTLLDFAGHENAAIRTYFSYANHTGIDRDLVTLTRLLQTGHLDVRLGAHASWNKINDILDDFAAGRIDGKAVLDTD